MADIIPIYPLVGKTDTINRAKTLIVGHMIIMGRDAAGDVVCLLGTFSDADAVLMLEMVKNKILTTD